MTGETSIGGVYLPTLLLIAIAALMITGALSTLLQLTGAYRFVAYRPIADISLFVILLGLGVALFLPPGS
ncbi:DUF1656 domain-containing protein [Burkholderia cenocepacia]|uniref:DUF1656 domain-containing protein n=1 Tax=Burkholderia cenocepacia TaxID=95486 RepID=UPI0009FFF7D2|nr:DUF1656 domain-containing protein [Burkholderia cenocepacia]MCW3678747.1 DUF1656 domain-containing protein [Burkholderia cenocepacia]MDC6086531.1 DUF1656 domain-containing protein [Burkholderia cenocepacia]